MYGMQKKNPARKNLSVSSPRNTIDTYKRGIFSKITALFLQYQGTDEQG